jgi:hypothetical protein
MLVPFAVSSQLGDQECRQGLGVRFLLSGISVPADEQTHHGRIDIWCKLLGQLTELVRPFSRPMEQEHVGQLVTDNRRPLGGRGVRGKNDVIRLVGGKPQARQRISAQVEGQQPNQPAAVLADSADKIIQDTRSRH